MFISYGELIFMLICAAIISVMLFLLFVANYTLLRENRYLKTRLRGWRKNCERHHATVPF
jgi:hypothetical protein